MPLMCLALVSCARPPAEAHWALYRTSAILPDDIYIASFDADEGGFYNQENCEEAALLFQRQPGVRVQYFCRVK